MKTEVSRSITIPSDRELMDLLGEKIYEYYNVLCKTIVFSFDPDKEIWDSGSRRGKYFHGYYIYKKFIQVHMFLNSEYLMCHFLLRKIHREKIRKKIEIFSKKTQKRFEEEGIWADFLILNENDEDFEDAIKVIEILSSTRKRKEMRQPT